MFITNDLEILFFFSISDMLHSLVVNDALQEKLCNGLKFSSGSLVRKVNFEGLVQVRPVA